MFIRRLATIALLIALAVQVRAQAPSSYDDLRRDARAAYDAKEYARFLDDMTKMLALRPNHPTLLINQAGAFALNGKKAEALSVIRTVVGQKVYFDAADSDFDSLREDPGFKALAAQLVALQKERVAGAEIALRIPLKGLITEGLAVDSKRGDFYVSSARKGKIVVIDGKGRTRDFTRSDPSLHGLSGIGIDAGRRILWACNTSSPRFESFKKGDPNDASLVAFDLKSGRVLKAIKAPDKEAFFDDLTVARDGTVYVSDSTGSVLRLRAGREEFETLVPHGMIRSPQGSVLSSDEKTLFVADYGGPIRTVDVVSGNVTALEQPADFQPMGIDGLTRRGNSLIAVQNGIEPNRIVRLDLSGDGSRIQSWKILEMNHPDIDEPTIGKVVGDRYYFIGTSQGNKFDRGTPDVSKLSDGLVFRINL